MSCISAACSCWYVCALAGVLRHHKTIVNLQPLVVEDARQPGLDSLANVAAADANGADLPLLFASGRGRKTLHAQHAAAAASQHQPPSPEASCRSRAGSVAPDDLGPLSGAHPGAFGPTLQQLLQQPQTLQQAIKAEAAAGAAVTFSPQGGAARPGGPVAKTQRRLGQKAAASKAGGAAAVHAAAAGGTLAAEPPLAFSKTLDYKSCGHIMCLTKDMAQQLLPPCSATGLESPCQACAR